MNSAQQLFEQIRCITCESQSIAHSDTPMANQMREYIVSLLDAGQGEKEIIQTLVDKYGQEILMTPQIIPQTYALWFLPLVVFFLIILRIFIR